MKNLDESTNLFNVLDSDEVRNTLLSGLRIMSLRACDR